ncbi:MAG: tRNA lysidine(34) synthetase TilS [Longimicrobiales bacterium]|nr:tRNA lysidine(34) synthetase TilS [Longimicrobiales bacterium]
MTDARGALGPRFSEVLGRDAGLLGSKPIVAAVSGGMDSVVLLHLLRSGLRNSGIALHVVHVDHGLRLGSEADARWVSGLCRAWGLPLHQTQVAVVGGSEEAARNARYTAIEKVRRAVGASWVALGHHADDQAETVLHRIVRGTGIEGLAAMAQFREPGIWRPLLSFSRDELEAYATENGLAWRTDPTNTDLSFARNAIRHVVIPALESGVSSGARRALVHLASLSGEESEAWVAAMPILLAQVGIEREDGKVSLSIRALQNFAPPLRAKVLRSLARGLGVSLDRVGTRVATEFTSSGLSGQEVSVTGGLRVRRELDRLVVALGSEREEDIPLVISNQSSGSGTVRLSGQTLRVDWGVGEDDAGAGTRITVRDPRFPLTLRARQDGDRIQLAYGSKKLKKLFLEARIPEPKRRAVPVLVDADGRVLWIVGLAESALPASNEAAASLEIGIIDANAD